MTKRYRITVDGTSYEVEVEELGAGEAGPAKGAASKPTVQAPAAAPVEKEGKKGTPPEPTGAAEEGTETVSAPMPGKILKVAVRTGMEVKEGDLLLVLEAMKMENEIFSPAGGKVTEVKAHEGDSVNTGDTLVVLG